MHYIYINVLLYNVSTSYSMKSVVKIFMVRCYCWLVVYIIIHGSHSLYPF